MINLFALAVAMRDAYFTEGRQSPGKARHVASGR
jgi:hypothetical protein